MIATALLLLVGASAPEDQCGYPADIYMEQLEVDMARHAADAIDRAGQGSWRSDKVLARLISPSAEVAFGAGDVGMPMEKGISGLRELALALNADQFRYRRSPYIPTPTDPCGEHKVIVEFVSSKSHGSSDITFTFRDGRIVGAAGWNGVFIDGPLRPAKPN
jgi:hypothetical protein